MKRITALSLAFVLLFGSIPMLFSCGTGITGTQAEAGSLTETEDSSKTEGETVTETESECVTEMGSESETESTIETETESETESETETLRPTEEELEARREEIYEATVGNRLMVANYGELVPADKMQEVYELLLEAGVNTVITLNSIYNTVGEGNNFDLVFETAKATGMDLIIGAMGYSSQDMLAKLTGREEYYDLIKAILLKDEPTPDQFESLSETRFYLPFRIPAAENWDMGANMLPLGSSSYEPGNRFDFETTGWADTVRKYIETVAPSFLCFDYYPWTSGGTITHYMSNLLLAKKVACEYEIPLHTFIEASFYDVSWDQFKLQSQLSLANGAEALYLFLAIAVSSHNYGVVFNADGSVNWTFYYTMEGVLSEIHAMKGVYLDYDWQSTILVGAAQETFAPSIREAGAESTLNESGSFGELVSVTAKDAVVGCFEKENGERGLYVVNCDQDSSEYPTEVILSFGEEILYEIWGAEGLERIGYADTLTLEMYSSDGKFVMINPELPE